ncbi:DNA mismatch repair protein [Chitinophaga sp. YIM B06452]|uniref:MutS-related protein n=1 Tax=Chitinophaga sp. YIM B06452 TaxID=3082158 RepID=UPI0031FE5ADE
MYLQTDEQTIADLEIFGRHNARGIYDIYNQVHTRGGEALLQEMFRGPLADRGQINQRSSVIRHFSHLHIPFPYNASLLDMAEKYLSSGDHQAPLSEKEIQNGVSSIIALINLTVDFINKNEIAGIYEYATERNAIAGLLADPAFAPALKEGAQTGRMSYAATTAYDALFRFSGRNKVETLLGYIYRLDVYMSVAKTAVERRFVFANAHNREPCILKAEGVYHPALTAPVGNNIALDAGRNVVFLTGANMAGKSTFLRALSTALYLAHMGFPVAAASMEFSVMDGLYTTVNLPDNLGIGASHFYAEVMRVKKIAAELHASKALFVLFDELFRGTNVKDAEEATIAVTKGFAAHHNSLFIISSHIMEAGEALRACSNIRFLFLPTRMKGHTPEYTYKLEEGITDDRHGMIIIRNEGILDILKHGKKNEQHGIQYR